MILVDLNQVMIASMMAQLGRHQNAQVDENMLRHMVLNSLRANRIKFKDEFGELIICCDDTNYWRKDVYPYYKASRKKDRDKSEMDWNSIFVALNKVRSELKEFFPYKVIQISRTEADDIIGAIVHKEGTVLNTGEKILILSGDKDYIQLHKYANVQQYDPVKKRHVKHSNPDQYLEEHILKGDKGDGVPNVLSSDDTFVMNKRQLPLTKKKIETFKDINSMSSEVSRNYFRNKKLIDLSEIRTDIHEKIMEEYAIESTNDRSKLFNYFMKNRLKLLMESINQF